MSKFKKVISLYKLHLEKNTRSQIILIKRYNRLHSLSKIFAIYFKEI